MKNPSHKKKAERNRKKTYEEYALENSHSADADYLDVKSDVATERALGDGNYGALGERLRASGLSDSGYEDYIRARVELNAESAEAKAAHERELHDYGVRSGYAKYASDYDKLQRKLSAGVIEKLSAEEKPDYEKMLSYALNAGLNGESAKSAAAASFRAATDNAVYRAIAFSQNNGLSAARAKKYALDEGLNEDAANRVYDAVQLLLSDSDEKYYTLSADDYIDYPSAKMDCYKKISQIRCLKDKEVLEYEAVFYRTPETSVRTYVEEND